MDNLLLSKLKKYNFWDNRPQRLGYFRSEYIEYLVSLLDSNLIKVLSGQRRVGKSYILRQLINFLIENKGVSPFNILYINFELEDFAFSNSAEDFSLLIKTYLGFIESQCPELKNQKIFFFFDEIQQINNWESIINSYHADHTIDLEIFITGSNSKLLSSEFSTLIAGRYINMNVCPFSYKEFLESQKLENSKDTFLQHLLGSSLPEFYSMNNDEAKYNFIKSLKNSIILKDIVQRYEVHNVDLLEKIFLFLANNISNLFSINSIMNKLKSLGYKSNTTTLGNYIRYLEDTFIIHGIDRYDLKGKKILEGEKKYYLNDLAFKNFLFSNFDQNRGNLLENYIFNALIKEGYQVYTGNLSNLEIDFVAQKKINNKNNTLYIQVAYIVQSEELIEREFGNLEKIQDSWTKIVVSLDDITLDHSSGIKHLQAWHFEDFLKHRSNNF